MEELRNQDPADDTDSGRRLGPGAKRLGIVNAVLCGLLVVAIVVALHLCVTPVVPLMGEGSGILGWIMLVFFIPLASIPIGISCLVGIVRSRAALRRHPSREARIGLWLSLGGVIAVMACYALAWGILLQ